MHTSTFLAVCVVFALLAGAVAPTTAQTDTTQIIGQPTLAVYSPTMKFTPGQVATLDLYVTNEGEVVKGGPAQYVDRVTLARATSLRVSPGDAPVEVDTGRIPAGDVPTGIAGPFPVQLTIAEDAPPGRYRLDVDVDYVYTRIVTIRPTSGDPEPRYIDVTETETLTIPLVVEDTARFAVVDAESDVLVGDRGTFDVTLENVGTDPATDVRVTVVSESPEVQFGAGGSSAASAVDAADTVATADTADTADTEASSAGNDSDSLTTTPANESAASADSTAQTAPESGAGGEAGAFVSSLEPGQSVTLRYTVSVAPDVDARAFPIGVDVTYEDRDGLSQRALPVSTTLRPGDEQSFSLENVSTSLAVGREGNVTGTLVNDGPATVATPAVVLDTGSESLVVAEPEYALPTLAPGERGEFEFKVDVSDTADPGFREFTADVRYRTADGDVKTADPLSIRGEVGPERDEFLVETVRGDVPAGREDVVELRVTNNRHERFTDISVKAFFDDPLSSDDDEAFVPRLDPGESTNVTFTVSAAGDAAQKIYPASVDFEYDTPDGDTEVSEAYRVPVSVTERRGGGVGAGLPVSLVGVGVVALVVVAGVWFWRRR